MITSDGISFSSETSTQRWLDVNQRVCDTTYVSNPLPVIDVLHRWRPDGRTYGDYGRDSLIRVRK